MKKNLIYILFILLFFNTLYIRHAFCDPLPPGGVTALEELNGFQCMGLRRQFISYVWWQDIRVPILEQPHKGSKWIVDADLLVIATKPLKRKNGFVKVLCPNWRLGWIENRYIEPWGPPPVTPCRPHRMSNGYPGA